MLHRHPTSRAVVPVVGYAHAAQAHPAAIAELQKLLRLEGGKGNSVTGLAEAVVEASVMGILQPLRHHGAVLVELERTIRDPWMSRT